MEKRIVGFCGIVCSECRAYVATQKNDLELKKEVARSWSTEEWAISPGDIHCEGCLATGEGTFKFCETCDVRRCALAKGVENCGHCADFPCSKLSGLWKSMGTAEAKATLEEMKRTRGN
ncbi:MAG: DUF3795 domain-containing protein [Dehalococcoidia bacterium]